MNIAKLFYCGKCVMTVDMDFFCGTEVQDYVWIEFNGTKRKSFFYC